MKLESTSNRKHKKVPSPQFFNTERQNKVRATIEIFSLMYDVFRHQKISETAKHPRTETFGTLRQNFFEIFHTPLHGLLKLKIWGTEQKEKPLSLSKGCIH